MGNKMAKKKGGGSADGGATAERVPGGTDDGGDGPEMSLPDSLTTLASGAKVSIEDFDLIKVLGKGSFGKVMMVRKKDTGEVSYLFRGRVQSAPRTGGRATDMSILLMVQGGHSVLRQCAWPHPCLNSQGLR